MSANRPFFLFLTPYSQPSILFQVILFWIHWRKALQTLWIWCMKLLKKNLLFEINELEYLDTWCLPQVYCKAIPSGSGHISNSKLYVQREYFSPPAITKINIWFWINWNWTETYLLYLVGERTWRKHQCRVWTIWYIRDTFAIDSKSWYIQN